ncbi:MAG: lipase [Gaiellales bacterium]|nr:lipase [Gaiellales bacterium]
MLAIHGVTGHGARYRALGQEGVPECRWLAVDLRGHGRSTWVPPWTTEQHVADLLETLDAEGIERCSVVGHSFGGHVAMHLAATAPDRVERIVLLDPASALDPADMLEAAEATRQDEGWPTEEEARRARREGRPPQALPFADEDIESALEQSGDGRFRMRYCRSTVVCAWSEMARAAATLAGWPGEALLIQARQESTVSDALVQSLQRDLGKRLKQRPVDAGHVVYWDAFDDVVSVLRTFLLPAAPDGRGNDPVVRSSAS